MFRKCGVPMCNSVRNKVKLHKMPIRVDLLNIWVNTIVTGCSDYSNLDDKFTKQELIKQLTVKNVHVCHKHFERRFIKDSMRLTERAVPTLFTDNDITSGVPSSIEVQNYSDAVQDTSKTYDHVYSKKMVFHVDHTYASGKEELYQGKSDHNYSNDVVHYDHTYSRVIATTGIQSVGAAATVSQKDQPSTSSTGINKTSTATDDSADDTFEHNDYTPTSPDPPPDFGAPSRETVFSWQTSELIAADEDEPEPEVVPTLDLEGPADPSGVSLYEDPETVTCGTAPPGTTTVEYRCKECGEAIEGFQFWCVQCVGRVVCGACDARGPHRTHYVLRVPAGKPQSQTQGVLATIRQQLQNENLLTLIEVEEDGVKVEVKDEPVEEPVPPAASPAPPAEPDPLACDPPAPAPAPIPAPAPAPAPRLPLPRLPPILRHAQRPREVVAITDYNQPFKRPRLLNYHTAIEKRTIPSSQNSTNRLLAMKVTSEPTPTELAVPIVLDDDEVYTEVETLDDDIEEVEYVERLEEGIEEERLEDVERLEDEDIERLEDVEHNYDSDSEASEYIPEKRRRIVRTDDDDSSDESDVENITTRGLSKRIESIAGRSISKIVESVSGKISNIENVAKRSMDRRKNQTEETLKLRGPEELMSKILPTQARIRVRPLSNLEVKKWTGTSK